MAHKAIMAFLALALLGSLLASLARGEDPTPKTIGTYVNSEGTYDTWANPNGPSVAQLMITKRTKDGRIVLQIALQGDSFTCKKLLTCEIAAQFDDEKPFALSGWREPLKRTTIFLDPTQDLLDRLNKAKIFAVSVNTQKEGLRHFRFKVSGSDWPPKDTPSEKWDDLPSPILPGDKPWPRMPATNESQ
jgi:hypothetical protein